MNNADCEDNSSIPKNHMILYCHKDLELHSFQEEWADELFTLVEENREHLQPWLAWVPHIKNSEDTHRFIQQAKKLMKEDNAFRGGIFWKQQLVGTIGISGVNQFSSDRHGNVGYWLSKTKTGKGIATTSVKRIIAYAFDDIALHRLSLKAATNNPKSWGIAERTGFIREGCMREASFVNGRFLDIYIYGMLNRDYQKQKEQP